MTERIVSYATSEDIVQTYHVRKMFSELASNNDQPSFRRYLFALQHSKDAATLETAAPPLPEALGFCGVDHNLTNHPTLMHHRVTMETASGTREHQVLYLMIEDGKLQLKEAVHRLPSIDPNQKPATFRDLPQLPMLPGYQPKLNA